MKSEPVKDLPDMHKVHISFWGGIRVDPKDLLNSKKGQRILKIKELLEKSVEESDQKASSSSQ